MQCFTVMSDEIEMRIDPLYYSQDILKKFKKTKFNFVEIKDVVNYLKSGFPAGKEHQSHIPNDFIQIRPTNIDKESQLVFDRNIYLSKDLVDNKEEEIVLKKEVLFNNTNSQELVGKTTFFDLDGIYFCSNHITRIGVNKEMLSPKYLMIILNIYQKSKVFFNLCTNWNNQSGINSNLLSSVKIPLPTLEIQNKVISIMDKAYSSKKLKESETHDLLDSIDDYVLDELGISLLELKDEMCFTVNFEKVETGRIDPISFIHPQDTPGSESFKEKSLSEIADLVKGQSITKENITSGGYPVIAGGQSSPYSIDEYNHNGNIITVSASGAYSGFVWYHDYPIFASDCTVIKSINEKEISTYYLFCVMKAKQKFIYDMQQGAGQPHVYSRDLSKLKIPLAPISIQNKITDEVKKRMRKAETLQKEAKEELEKAKSEVEKIILG